ncbi:mycofactocin precursor MftA [Nocardioides dubius]
MNTQIDPIDGADEQITADMLIEEVSIDGMCGVY